MKKIKLLVVDDDIAITRLLSLNLRSRGYDVAVAGDGEEAIRVVEGDFFNLIILDIMLPKIDGIEVFRRIRAWSKIPVIILSAKGNEQDKVAALDMGADDYLTKPFSIPELMARIKTTLRHSESNREPAAQATTSIGAVEIDFSRQRVMVHGNEIKLTKTEFLVLQELVTNRDKVLTHQMILQKIWGAEYGLEKEYTRVFVSRLRKKLGDNTEHTPLIQTVNGVGYQICER
ncbi:MAG: response regulator transcription factor [Dehalococcoidales bacterium]|nr:response regulator transcription factor [Dehalococcoidales bacterium]